MIQAELSGPFVNAHPVVPFSPTSATPCVPLFFFSSPPPSPSQLARSHTHVHAHVFDVVAQTRLNSGCNTNRQIGTSWKRRDTSPIFVD